jgi:hypothetical protein
VPKKYPQADSQPADVQGLCFLLVRCVQENIPRPTFYLRATRNFHSSSKSQPVAVVIDVFRLFVAKFNNFNLRHRQSLQFRRFGDSTVVLISPQFQAGKSLISNVNLSIIVPAIFALARGSQKAGSMRGG